MVKSGGPMTAKTQDQIADLAEVFHLMGDPSRLRVLLLLLEGARPVGAIAETTGFSLSLVSHHLRLLRDGRLARAMRHGKQVIYSVDDEHIRRVLTDMVAHLSEGSPASDLGTGASRPRAKEA